MPRNPKEITKSPSATSLSTIHRMLSDGWGGPKFRAQLALILEDERKEQKAQQERSSVNTEETIASIPAPTVAFRHSPTGFFRKYRMDAGNPRKRLPSMAELGLSKYLSH